MSATPKNVIIAGATGSVGRPILDALLSHSSNFNVTILTRTNSSSTSTLPTNISTITVSPSFTAEELTAAFKNQDILVLATSTFPITVASTDTPDPSNPHLNPLSKRFIDVALTAGVTRIIPSTFGTSNITRPSIALSTVPIYTSKNATLKYLQEVSASSGGKLTWTSICCGSWIDWVLAPPFNGSFYHIDLEKKKATLWDSGRSRFACTTLKNVGETVARCLLPENIDACKDKEIFVADFMTDVLGIVQQLEREMGEGVKFEVERKDSGAVIRDLRERYDEGEKSAAYELVAMSVVSDVLDAGYEFDKEQGLWNGRLGLEEVRLEEVVKEAVARMGRS